MPAPRASYYPRGVWEGLEPPTHIRERQQSYDLNAQVFRMRQCGMTYAEIGRRIGCSAHRAKTRMVVFERWQREKLTPPVCKWMGPGDLSAIVGLMQIDDEREASRRYAYRILSQKEREKRRRRRYSMWMNGRT